MADARASWPEIESTIGGFPCSILFLSHLSLVRLSRSTGNNGRALPLSAMVYSVLIRHIPGDRSYLRFHPLARHSSLLLLHLRSKVTVVD